MRTLTFAFPLPPNLNREQTQHWGAKHRQRKDWYALCDKLQTYGKLPAPPVKPLARATVSAVLVMPAAMDEDNAFRRASKWPMDWLKTRGYIVNDTRKVLTWTGLPDQRITRSEEHRVEIVIQEAA